MTTLVIVIIILALVFDYINGFHDAANSIATIVSTKVLTPFQAVIWAAVFNSAAFFIFKDHAVANTISKTVYVDFITLPVILSGLIAAIFWNLLTWWYGIPSSSSHTLIGGFAGAAIAHAISTHGWSIAWSKIVDSTIIINTLLFIFLAPFIGMAISIFITVVTIMRNVWLRILIIAIATAITAFAFDKFEDEKIHKNAEKFLKMDKYKEEVAKTKTALLEKPNDVALQEKLKVADAKLAKASENYDKIDVLLDDYDRLGADEIAKRAFNDGLLKEIEASKLKDEVRNANGFLVMQSEAATDPEKKKFFDKVVKVNTDEPYKAVLKRFLQKELTTAAAIDSMSVHYPIADVNKANITKRMNEFSIQNAFKKDLEKADNSGIVWGIVLSSLLFCLVYIYVEKIKTPTAYKVANMFKSLQLFSSAAFSIGHGGNDAQKVMGIIGAALIAGNTIQDFSMLPNWVPISCYLAIGLGTMSGGWKIVKTMGTKITKVTPLEGVAAETAGAFTLFFTGQMGIPVSTTHTITGSIIGVGATKRLSAVRWGVTINLLWAWIITIPISGLLAALTYYIYKLF